MSQNNISRIPAAVLWEKVRQFFFAFLFGFVIHSQALFFPTDATDSIRAYGSTGAQVGSGRFVGHLLDVLFERFGFYQPYRYINVLLYIALIAVAAVLLTEIFDIRSRILSMLMSAVLLSCAMNSGILAYYYVSYMYAFVLVLDLTACLLLLKKQMVVLPGLLLAFSLGIYQAFLPTVILIIFIYQLRALADPAADAFAWIRNVLRCMLTVIEGLGIYLLSNRIYLTVNHLSMSGYANMGDNVLPPFTLSGMIEIIIGSYRFFFQMPFKYQYFISDNVVMRVCLGFFLCLLAAELILLWVRTKVTLNRVLLALLILVLPVFINLPAFMQEELGERLSLNWYFVILIPLILLDTMWLNPGVALRTNAGRRGLAAALFAGVLFFGCSSVLYNAYRNVNIYTSYIRSHEIAEDIVQDVEERIDQCPGFRMEDEVIFIGTLDTQSIGKYFYNVEYQEFLYKLFNRDHSSIFRRYATHEYRILIPEDARIRKLTVDEYSGLSGTASEAPGYFCLRDVHGDLPTIHSDDPRIAAMPSYPDAGCVKKIDGIVVCKFGP